MERVQDLDSTWSPLLPPNSRRVRADSFNSRVNTATNHERLRTRGSRIYAGVGRKLRVVPVVHSLERGVQIDADGGSR
jgi:hypothetical protein